MFGTENKPQKRLMTSAKRYLQVYNKHFQLTSYFLSFEDVV